MNYRRCKEDVRVRMNRTGADAAKGDEGFIHELRGYNRLEGGKIDSRWVMVWIDTQANGRPTRRVISCTSNEINEIN